MFSKLNLVIMGGDSGEWNSSDFEMDSDGGYPFAGEHYGVAGTPVPSRSIEGWYPGARARVAERAVCCVLRPARNDGMCLVQALTPTRLLAADNGGEVRLHS